MVKPLRILIVDDSENDTMLLLRKLKKGGYDPIHQRVDNAKDMGLALAQKQWEIVIADHLMPNFSEIGALEILREQALDIPCIVVSGTMGEDVAVAAMRAGASDYVMKNNLTRLVPAIERELREVEERKARRKAEEQFRQAQKMESIGRLAGGVAHDFNNLLTAIFASCAFLLESKKFNQDDVLEIKAAAERAALLTRQLLAFSRKQVFQVRVLDLNSIVVNVEKLLRRVIGEDIEFVINLKEKLGSVTADSAQIEQVIMNLCVNARDAMPEGGKLEIRTVEATLDESYSTQQFDIKPGPYIMLSVTDTGSGMSQEVLSHLFEPFFTTKVTGKGTGLGLSTVYGIVKQSGGYILVDSELGRGTTFRIYFPRGEEAEKVEGPAPATLKVFKGSETVLFVEDDERLRKLCKRILVREGYVVLEAGNGQEALAVCNGHTDPIHILVTDVVMPEIGGEALAKQVVQLRPTVKVLYLSGYAESLMAEKGVLKPGINFLSKPFTLEALARKVREVLDSFA